MRTQTAGRTSHAEISIPGGVSAVAGHLALLGVLAYFAFQSWPGGTAPGNARPTDDSPGDRHLVVVDNAPARLIVVVDEATSPEPGPSGDARVPVEIVAVEKSADGALAEALLFANVGCPACGPVWLVDLRPPR